MKPIEKTVYVAKATFSLSMKGTVGDLFTLQKAFVFTPEELNEYTANVIKQALENAAGKADITYTQEKTFDFTEVDKQSITNTFEETYRLFSVD